MWLTSPCSYDSAMCVCVSEHFTAKDEEWSLFLLVAPRRGKRSAIVAKEHDDFFHYRLPVRQTNGDR